MSDTLDKFLRTTKRIYERLYNEMTAGKIGIDQFLFGADDFSTQATFALDELLVNPHGVCFRHAGEQSAVRPYTPGTGTVYEVPRTSEKTPISEDLRDSVVAGIESTADFSSHNSTLLNRIMKIHLVAHNVTRWKLAIDVIRTGKFSPKGLDGKDIGLEIDFARSADQNITYDFTAAGATIDEALGDMYDAYIAQGGARSNVIVLMGKNWQMEFEQDDDVIEKMKANSANIILEQNMMPPSLKNTYGLYYFAMYRPAGCLVPLWLCAYSPDKAYVAYKGATAADFLPDDEAIMFSLDSPRYRVFRGVDAKGGDGRVVRSVGEVVIDTFSTDDPVTEFIRSQSRYAMIPGNVNETVRSTGTFTSSS